MSARRQSSTTSLSKYARASSPDPSNRSLDFCNAFWGFSDGGVDVLFARMRGASRTMTELRAYWKERSAIEEEYAKRMAKLAKMSLGKDEIGELRNSLDTLRLETDKQAGYHQNLAKTIRDELESPTTGFVSRQAHHKKTFQAAIEKKFKTKQQQEFHVNQAGEKYKSDCLRINSYTAQSTLMQGKELEKIQLKLERAHQTVQANERDFANFARHLQTTVTEWEQDWKAFCDSCQDQEEERMEFMKDTMWAYANAVSTVCVSDDESCEKMRLALEQMEPEKDMENFVRDYGTGNAIPDPPSFVNYNNSEAVPSGSSRPTSRPAQFPRSSQRSLLPRQPPPPEDEEPLENAAGVGAIGRKGVGEAGGDFAPPSRSQTQSRGSTRGPVNGSGPVNSQGGSTQPLLRQPTNASQYQSSQHGSFKPPNDPSAEPIDPTIPTLLKVGNSEYQVDPSKDPQQQHASLRPSTTPLQNGIVGESNDPLAQKMAEFRNAASSEGSVRRNSTYRQNQSDSRGQNHAARKITTTRPGASASPPSSSKNLTANAPPTSRDYRNSAEIVVGAYPSSASRPSSPNPPTASFMIPPQQSAVSPPLGDQPVDSVLADYQQSFPGEGKSISRSNSRRSSFTGAPNTNTNQSQGQNLARPVSREGHAGIGTHGSQSRSASPALQQGPAVIQNNNHISPIGSASTQPFNKSGSVSQSTPTANKVGIAIDPSGKVAMDAMADLYRQQQPQPQQPYHSPPTVSRNPTRLSSYGMGNNNGVIPPSSQPYDSAQPPSTAYQQTTHTSYVQPAPARQPYGNQSSYAQPPPLQYPPAPPASQTVYQPQPHAGEYTEPGLNGSGLSHASSQAGSYNSQSAHLTAVHHPYGTGGRTPSPQPPAQPQQLPPTGQYTEDGRGVLFYVKALYDYSATIEEEFDFQAGDIIAVTATPEDGWWSGELLDEARRQPGRHVFPSNFVCLF